MQTDHMHNAFAVLCMTLACITGGASEPLRHQPKPNRSGQRVAKQIVINAAKRLSTSLCKPPVSAGCDYDALFVDGKWHVAVAPYALFHGKHMNASGGPSYVFDAKGKLVEVIGGM